MDWDFSKVNMEYLIQARDLTRSNPRELALITQFKPPLIAPRHAAWWWQRLLNALQAGNPEELRIILDHAGLDLK
jgi:hypothetical protein